MDISRVYAIRYLCEMAAKSRNPFASQPQRIVLLPNCNYDINSEGCIARSTARDASHVSPHRPSFTEKLVNRACAKQFLNAAGFRYLGGIEPKR